MFVVQEDPDKVREAERREYFRVTKKRTDNFDFKTESGMDAIGCQLISSNTQNQLLNQKLFQIELKNRLNPQPKSSPVGDLTIKVIPTHKPQYYENRTTAMDQLKVAKRYDDVMRSLQPSARYLEPLLKLKNDDPRMKAAHKVCRETPSDTFLPVIERARSVPIRDRPIDMNHFRSDSPGFNFFQILHLPQ